LARQAGKQQAVGSLAKQFILPPSALKFTAVS